MKDNEEFAPHEDDDIAQGEAPLSEADGTQAPDLPEDESVATRDDVPAEDADPVVAAKISELEEIATERTADLQRLQAEYANYKKRVDRDRSLARAGGIESVVTDLLPVLDAVEAAREQGDLTGGFKLVADELSRLGAKYGLELYGEVGEPFDPTIHEALMQVPAEGDHDVTVVSAVMQKGVRLADRIVRPARVGVADPQ
ncbi:nucleotide exchange factor GrpE [Nigerium massiliense]|uniref:nucleotide exchange factor GrpE n=1 Tax=Nigerium massiliense TaxID=1522317 RepID=UPI000A9BF88B|nr:nucleotide exchange factor GrpE [Nigerium massiliense]